MVGDEYEIIKDLKYAGNTDHCSDHCDMWGDYGT